jgi:hypothetical protein
MPKKSKDDLRRKGERGQKTKKADLQIPVPERKSVLDALTNAVRKKPPESGSSSR